MDFPKTLDLLSELAALIGPSGRILYINPAGATFFNSPNAVGRSWKNVVSPFLQHSGDIPPLDDIGSLLNGAVERQGSVTMLKDGAQIQVRYRAARIHGEEGGHAFALVMDARAPVLPEKPPPEPTSRKPGVKEIDHLNAINRAQALYIAKTEPSLVFSEFLESLLPLTGSEYGFIGEALEDKTTGQPFIRILAVSSSVWNEGMRALRDRMESKSLEFRKLDSLLGAILTQKKTVISNNIPIDPRSGGLPAGHVRVDAFMGVPVFVGERLAGVLGLANRRGGYELEMEADLKSSLKACSVIFESMENARRMELAEKARQESEDELRLLINSLPSLIAYVDSDERYRIANKVYKDWFGIAPSDIIDRKVNDVIGAANYNAIKQYINKALAGKKVKYESSLEMPGGEHRHVEGTLVPNVGPENLVKGYFVLVNDITERKTAEDAVKQAEAKWRSLVENAADTILLLDGDGRISFANHLTFTLSLKDMVGTCVLDHVPEEYRKTVAAALERSRQSGKPEQFEMQAKGPFGSLLWRSTTISSFTIDDDTPMFIMITRDISESKRVEEELRATAERLKEMDAFKNKMLSIISHDLRSPLTSNIGLLRLMLKSGKDPLSLRQQQIVETMERSNTLLLGLVENLLELSKLRRGLVTVNPRPTPSAEIIETSCMMLRQMAADKEIKIVLESDPDAWLNVDKEKMIQVINNLVSNSIKFSNSGGVITINSTTDGDDAVLTVKDEGVGVAPSDIPTLFDLSRKTTTLGTHGEKGGGLGLAISKEITELNGGMMIMESMPGAGTTVRLRFKRYMAAALAP